MLCCVYCVDGEEVDLKKELRGKNVIEWDYELMIEVLIVMEKN